MLTVKRAFATLSATALLVVGIAGPASAANQQQNGLVNVAVGDVTLQNINIGVAAGIAASACGINVGPVAVLAVNVDATGTQRTVCNTAAGPVTLTQA